MWTNVWARSLFYVCFSYNGVEHCEFFFLGGGGIEELFDVRIMGEQVRLLPPRLDAPAPITQGVPCPAGQALPLANGLE